MQFEPWPRSAVVQVTDIARIPRCVAVVQASSCSSDATPTLAWELPYATGAVLKKRKKKKKKKEHPQTKQSRGLRQTDTCGLSTCHMDMWMRLTYPVRMKASSGTFDSPFLFPSFYSFRVPFIFASYSHSSLSFYLPGFFLAAWGLR